MPIYEIEVTYNGKRFARFAGKRFIVRFEAPEGYEPRQEDIVPLVEEKLAQLDMWAKAAKEVAKQYQSSQPTPFTLPILGQRKKPKPTPAVPLTIIEQWGVYRLPRTVKEIAKLPPPPKLPSRQEVERVGREYFSPLANWFGFRPTIPQQWLDEAKRLVHSGWSYEDIEEALSRSGLSKATQIYILSQIKPLTKVPDEWWEKALRELDFNLWAQYKFLWLMPIGFGQMVSDALTVLGSYAPDSLTRQHLKEAAKQGDKMAQQMLQDAEGAKQRLRATAEWFWERVKKLYIPHEGWSEDVKEVYGKEGIVGLLVPLAILLDGISLAARTGARGFARFAMRDFERMAAEVLRKPAPVGMAEDARVAAIQRGFVELLREAVSKKEGREVSTGELMSRLKGKSERDIARLLHPTAVNMADALERIAPRLATMSRFADPMAWLGLTGDAFAEAMQRTLGIPREFWEKYFEAGRQWARRQKMKQEARGGTPPPREQPSSGKEYAMEPPRALPPAEEGRGKASEEAPSAPQPPVEPTAPEPATEPARAEERLFSVEEQPKVETPKEIPTVGEAGVEPQVTTPPPATRKLELRAEQLGRENEAFTAKGTAVKTRFAVVDINDLLVSHDLRTWHENPDYPAELQPRDRSSAAMQQQVKEIAANLRPPKLGDSASTSNGAPIVGSDGVVESGNGRTLALKIAYAYGLPTAEDYRRWLVENAEQFGINPLTVSTMRAPVLVRLREPEEDMRKRAELVLEMGLTDVAPFSSVERALADANIVAENINLFNPDEPLTSEKNKRFVQAFLSKIPTSEHNEMLMPGGELSLSGEERITNALLAYGFPNYQLLLKMMESRDLEVRRLFKAIAASAPQMSRLKAVLDTARRRGKDAEADAYDITRDIANAALRLEDIRRAGHRVSEYLQQGELFSGFAIPQSEKLLLAAFDALTSQKQLRLFLETYADMARRALELAIQPAHLLTGAMREAKQNLPTKEQILTHALSVARGGGTSSLFEEESAVAQLPTAEEILQEVEEARRRAREERERAKQETEQARPAEEAEQARPAEEIEQARPAEEIEQAVTETPESKEELSAARRVADAVFAFADKQGAGKGDLLYLLRKGGDWSRENIFKWARENIEGWTGSEEEIDWLFDAIEAVIASRLGNTGVDLAIEFEEHLPRRARTTKLSELQQFSTPFPIAYVMQELAQVRPDDYVYEPTAGTGNLIWAVPELLSDKGALLLNELSDRRFDLLRRIAERWGKENVVLHKGDALRLRMKGKPTVILMNPPWGKYSTGKYGKGLPGMVDVAERFVQWELDMHLAEGGRLVALMPLTVLDSPWLQKLHKEYRVQWVIRLPGWLYKHRGTNVGSVILVVDKAKPVSDRTLHPLDLSRYTEEASVHLFNALRAAADAPKPREEVSHGPRPVFEDTGEGGESAGEIRRPVSAVSAPSGTRPAGESGGEEAREGGAAEVRGGGGGTPEGSVASGGVLEPATVVANESEHGGGSTGAHPEEQGLRAERFAGDGGMEEPAARAGAPASVVGENELRLGAEEVPAEPISGLGEGTASGVPVAGGLRDREGTGGVRSALGFDEAHGVPASGRVSDERRREAEQDIDTLGYDPSLYARYIPLDSRELSEHPRLVVEPASLASMPRPAITIEVPDVLRRMRAEKVISDPQYDAAVLVLQAFENNHGVVVADDVGLGKTREIGAALFSLMAQGKVKRALITTFSGTNIIQMMEEFDKVFRRFVPQVKFVNVAELKLKTEDNIPLPMGDYTVYFAHRDNLKDFVRKYGSILAQQPVDVWFADESHTVRGGEGSEKNLGWRGMHAIMMIHGNNRVFYFSATPAQDPEELKEYYSLGYWTLDESSWNAFVNVITGEAVSLETWEQLMQKGRGLAEVTVTQATGNKVRAKKDTRNFMDSRPRLIDVRLRYSDLEQLIRELYSQGRYVSRDLSRYGVTFEVSEYGLDAEEREWLSRLLELFRDIEYTARIYSRLGDEDANRRAGRITSQLQFAMKRIHQALRLKKLLPDIERLIKEGKQVVLYAEAVSGTSGEEGNIASAIEAINTDEYVRTEQGYDFRGKIPEAIEAIARLKERAQEFNVPDPVTVLRRRFGDSEIAIVTGESGAGKRNVAIEEFNRGKRRIALISRAGSTGISLHDVNGRQRVLILLDTPWRADDFRQVLGRVDRTGQRSSPHILFASIGEAGERKIISTIARRLRSLGALSKGESAAIAGSSAFGQFEIDPRTASTVVRHLWSTRWREQGWQNWFTHREFVDIDHSGEVVPRATLPQGFDFKAFMLDLLVFMEPERANLVYEDFLREYTQWVNELEALSEKIKGTILTVQELRPGFFAYVVEDENHVRFGVIGGRMVLPQQGLPPYILEVRRVQRGDEKLKYVLVRDKETGNIISGVRVNLTALSALMSMYETGGEFTPDKAYALLLVDKAVHTFSPRSTKPYRLIRTRVRDSGEVRIRIDNARMDDKEVLFNAGARYDARLSYWYLPFTEEAFRRFISAFPLMPPSAVPVEGEKDEGEESSSIFFRTAGRMGVPLPNTPPLEGDGRPLDDTQAVIFRLGRFLRIARTKKQGITGWYVPQTGDVAIRRWGDIPSAVHEIAHALDDEFGILTEWAKPRAVSPFDEELMPFAPADRKYSSLREKRAEAFAHFMEALVINPEFAKSSAPEFYAYLRKKLPAEFWEEWEQFTEDIQRWIHGDAGAKIRAHFAFDKPSVEDTAPGTFRIHWVDQAMKLLLDDRWAAIKAWREALRRTGKQALPHEDFELLISLWAGRYGSYEDILRRGVPLALGGTLRSRSFIDLLSELDTSSWDAFQQDCLDLFALMGAQRALELVERKKAEVFMKLRRALKIEIDEQIENPAIDDDIQHAYNIALQQGDEKTKKAIEKAYEEIENYRMHVTGWGGGIFPDDDLAEQFLRTLERNDKARFQRLQRAADVYREIANALLDFAVSAGRLAKDDVEAIRKSNQFYVDFHRVFGMDAPRITQTTSGNITRVRQVTWKIHGSARQIHNPIVSLMESVARIFSEVHRNYALAQFVRVLQMERDMYEGEPVLLADIGREVDTPSANTVKIYIQGKEHLWEFHPDVKRAFETWENEFASEGWNALAWLMGGVARIAYHGVVLHPKFLIWNIARDTEERLVRGKYGAGLPKLGNREDWMFYGGSQAGFLHRSREDYYKQFEMLAEEVVGKPRHWLLFPAWAGKRLWEWYRGIAQKSEEAGRIDLYNKAYRYARTELGYDDWDAKLFAAFASRQHLDFRVAGSLVRVVNRLIPFTSASVRALAMAIDALIPAPGGGGKGSGRGGTPKGAGDMPWDYRNWGVRGTVTDAHRAFATWVKLFLFVGLISLLIRWWNQQDEEAWEEYQEFPEYQRYMFWLIRTPFGWLNVPKPYEYGVLAGFGEAVMDGELGEWAKTLARIANPVDEGDLALGLSGIVGAIANYDFFRGRWIVPPYEEERALFDDAGKVARKGVTAASPIARAVGLKLGIDPRKLDYILRQQGGHWGGTLSEVSRLMAGEKTGKQFLAQQLGLSRELSPYGAKSVQEAVRRAAQTGRSNEGIMQGLREQIGLWYRYREQGKTENLQPLLHRIIRHARRANKVVGRKYRVPRSMD